MGKGLFVTDDVFKGIRTPGAGAPYFKGAKGASGGEFGGLYTGQIGGKEGGYGPKGGHIKGVSPSSGKPIYYKKWSPSSKGGVKLARPTEGGGAPEGYSTYKHSPEHVIGKTGSGKHIHSHSGINNTKHYQWDDHRDASHAHFAMTQHLMNVLRQRSGDKKDTRKLQGLIDAHAGFARHHREQAVKDLLHGKQKGRSQEDLSLRESSKG